MAKLQGVELSDYELKALTSGMNQPAVRKFSTGTKIFRVASEKSVIGTATKKSDGEAGNWWFGKKAFNKIMKYCVEQDKDDRGLGYASREALAILFGWSDCDILIEGYLTKTVEVFTGKGNPQGQGSDKFKGWDDIEQWFIPNITQIDKSASGKEHVKLIATGAQAIKVYRQVAIRSVKGNAASHKES